MATSGKTSSRTWIQSDDWTVERPTPAPPPLPRLPDPIRRRARNRRLTHDAIQVIFLDRFHQQNEQINLP